MQIIWCFVCHCIHVVHSCPSASKLTKPFMSEGSTVSGACFLLLSDQRSIHSSVLYVSLHDEMQISHWKFTLRDVTLTMRESRIPSGTDRRDCKSCTDTRDIQTAEPSTECLEKKFYCFQFLLISRH